ncbi:Slp family lipoprotein [Methylacidimicrobium tartarophylax]|uniref:Outer membrane protein slp n=1 Tax=Methylacidimicrobium tartarophylax TaxID=1041768 RepID=A0A5E6M562_9BACT|nr:Slp family lipoprotein [Methylacidimicrobium tartarophylax]VVM04713.1 Outer membrane protein slp [Methylacidimicrobium tartarophylax]
MNRLFERKRRTTPWLALTILLVGCGSPFSSEVKKEVRSQPSFGAIRSDPSAYQGCRILLGGIIIKTTTLKEGTLLEVLEERLDDSDRPISTDKVGGRFLVRNSTFLDPSVYREGRDVTVVGRVMGVQAGRIGERPYTYPRISATQIYLWPWNGGQRDSPGLPRRDWVWGYPGKGWSNTWGSIPPMTVPPQ